MLAKIDEFQDLCGLQSRKQVLDNALTLLEYCIEQKKQGKSIYIGQSSNVEKEFTMRCLEHVTFALDISQGVVKEIH
jgi:hypothetical protein